MRERRGIPPFSVKSVSRRLLKPGCSRPATMGFEQIAVGVVNLDRSGIGERVGARELSCGSDYNAAGEGAAIVIEIGQKPVRERIACPVLPDTEFSGPKSVLRKGTIALAAHGPVLVEGHQGRKGRSHILAGVAVDAVSGYCPDTDGGIHRVW